MCSRHDIGPAPGQMLLTSGTDTSQTQGVGTAEVMEAQVPLDLLPSRQNCLQNCDKLYHLEYCQHAADTVSVPDSLP